MCDYSLESVKSVSAAKGQEYTLSTMGYAGSKGFKAEEDCAACVPEGTVMRIEVPEDWQWESGLLHAEDVVVTRLDVGNQHTYHDAVQFSGGRVEKLQAFPVGTRATVIMLGDVRAPEDRPLANHADPAPAFDYIG